MYIYCDSRQDDAQCFTYSLNAMIQQECTETKVGHITPDNTVEVMLSSEEQQAAYRVFCLKKREKNAIYAGHANHE